MKKEAEFWLINARLVTMEEGLQGYIPSEPSNVCIRNGEIAHISRDDSIPSHHWFYDCQNKLVTPGIIDCHTHLIFAGNRSNEFESRLTGTPYQEIARNGGGILSTVKATRNASQDELVDLALPRLDGLIRTGVTSVEIKSGYGLTLEDELKMLRAARELEKHRSIKVVSTLLAAHATPPEYSNNSDNYIAYVCNEIIPAVAEEKLATSVDVFCETIGFNLKQVDAVFNSAKQHGLSVKGHTEQLSNMGGSALTATHHGLSVDHIEFLDELGVAELAKFNTVATLLPGAFYFLKETQLPPIELLRAYNVPMAIASDFNPGTSPIADMNLMMNMACTFFGLTPQEALRGTTCNAAKALGFAHSRGQLRRGFDADFAIWEATHPADLCYQVGVPRLAARIVDGNFCSTQGASHV